MVFTDPNTFDATATLAAPAPAPPAVAAPPPSASATDVVVTPMTLHPTLPATAPSSTDEVVVMAHLVAPRLALTAERTKPLAIVATIDVSGSMRGEKLNLAKETLHFMVEQLSERDTFSIIAFETGVHTVLPLTTMDMAGKGRARSAIAALRDMGNTNLSGGLFRAMSVLRGEPQPLAVSPTSPKHGGHWVPSAPVASPRNAYPTKFCASPYPVSFSAVAAAPTLAPSAVAAAAPRAVPATCTVSHKVTQPAPGTWAWTLEVVVTCAAPVAGGFTVAAGAPPTLPVKTGNRLMWGPVDTKVPFFDVTVAAPGVPSCPPVTFCYVTDGAGETGSQTFAMPAALAGPAPVQPTLPTAPAVPVDARLQGATKCVMLFTDGEANAGISDTASLIAATRVEFQRPIAGAPAGGAMIVHTFGFGEGHNESLLQGIAEVAQGTYYYVKDAEGIKTSFADCLGGLLSIVAQKIELTVAPAPGFTIHQVHTAGTVVTGPGGARRIHLADLYSCEARDVVVRLRPAVALSAAAPAPLAVGSRVPLVTWSLACDNVLTAAPQASQVTCAVPVAAEPYTGPVDPAVEEQLVRVRATEELGRAREEAARGRFAEAETRLLRMQAAISSSSCAASAQVQQLYADVGRVAQASNATAWESEGKKFSAQCHMGHMQQRSNRTDESAGAGYANEWQYCMRGKAAKK